MVIVARGPLSLAAAVVLGQDLCEKGPFFFSVWFRPLLSLSLSLLSAARSLTLARASRDKSGQGGGKKEEWERHLHLNDYIKNTTFSNYLKSPDAKSEAPFDLNLTRSM